MYSNVKQFTTYEHISKSASNTQRKASVFNILVLYHGSFVVFNQPTDLILRIWIHSTHHRNDIFIIFFLTKIASANCAGGKNSINFGCLETIEFLCK